MEEKTCGKVRMGELSSKYVFFFLFKMRMHVMNKKKGSQETLTEKSEFTIPKQFVEGSFLRLSQSWQYVSFRQIHPYNVFSNRSWYLLDTQCLSPCPSPPQLSPNGANKLGLAKREMIFATVDTQLLRNPFDKSE